MMERSDIFQLRFTEAAGVTLQYRDRNWKGRCDIGSVHTDGEVLEVLEQRATAPFSFDQGPLYDLCLYPLADGRGVLSIRMHHILLDGFGMRILCDRILAAYAALRDGKTPEVPESHFLETIAAGPDRTATDQAFWKSYLASLPAPPVLSKERARTMSRCRRHKKVDASLCRDIKRFCDENRVTPYTVFAAALGIYLGRLQPSEDAVIILPRLNRSGEPYLSTLGVYTLAVPLRIKPAAHLTLASLCAQVREQGQEISRHKEYGYSRIMSDLKAAGELDGNLSEFTLNYQKGTINSTIAAWLDFSACGEMSNHITLNVNHEPDDRYGIDYDCRSDLYSEQRLDFFHGSLMQIIAAGLAGKPLGEIPVLTPAETAHIRALTRGHHVAYDRQETVVSLFRQAVAQYPDRPAIIGVDNQYTFAELDVLSDRLASGLCRRGVGKEQLVAFMLPRTTQILTAMLGILKAGAAFLPIDPMYPAGRIDYMLENSEAVLLISDPSVPAAVGRDYAAFHELLAGEPVSLPDDIVPEQAAYCIYTSGTTGRPKGVLLEHRSLVNITRPENNPFNRDICSKGRGIVAIGSICFDISLFEIFVPLLNGMFVVMAPEEAMADPVAIARLLKTHRANILHLTPSRLAASLTEPAFTAALQGVEVILAAGEVLPTALAESLRDQYGVRIYNGYGPTETTIGATITEAGDSESIGRPIANTCIRIVNARGEDVPCGAVGEILVGGNGVGRGYLKLPELTAEKFVTLEGERFYRTGDMGYLKADGRLMYLGRNDHQVKLRGLRIELPEIESWMRQYEGISNCAVLVREITGQQHLVAFYAASREIEPDKLKAFLLTNLTPYMVPDVFVAMPALPLTSNGKVDLEALRAYHLIIERQYRPPQTPEEETLCRIFAAVLQLEQVGADDNFFEIGGTSLLAAKVMLQARNENLSISYAEIFKYPTPRLLAAASGRIETSSPGRALAELDYSRIKPVLELNRVNRPPVSRRLGNVLLTGATGYLGIHVLKELIDHPESVDRIYCLVRSKGKIDPEKRLRSSLFYYFEVIDSALLDNRLYAVEGDITLDNLTAVPLEAPIDTIINSAANVAHFAYGDQLEQVNTAGVGNVIRWAREHGAAVVHISTYSVCGSASEEQIRGGMLLDEASLYVGQTIVNPYILSKYRAEYLLLQAAAAGLPVKIMRVGNLQGRLSDGEFQMNLRSNAFAKMLKSYALLQCAPQRLQTECVNFCPVDDTARAVYLLAGSHEDYTVFHPFNPHSVRYADIFAAMGEAGYPVRWMPDPEFEAMVESLAQNEEEQSRVEGILLEQPDIHLREVPCSAAMTASLLEGYQFAWGEITREYLGKYFEALIGLGFFDIDI